MSSRFTMVVAVHLFLLQENQILLARRFKTGYEDGNFSLPAGHVEAEETCLAAVIRETAEEAGIEVKENDLSLAHVMHRKSDCERIDFFFACRSWTGEPKINEPDKCDLISWYDLNQLPTNTVPYVKQAIGCFNRGQMYSEFGF